MDPAIQQSTRPVAQYVGKNGGTIAALTIPTLHPPTLKSALAAIKKLSDSPNARKAQASSAGKSKAPSPTKSDASPRLPVISAIVESKALSAVELGKFADLPPLEEVLAQLVGILESPARAILGISQQAAGGDLARALEGFRIGLQEKEDVQSSSPAAAGTA